MESWHWKTPAKLTKFFSVFYWYFVSTRRWFVRFTTERKQGWLKSHSQRNVDLFFVTHVDQCTSKIWIVRNWIELFILQNLLQGTSISIQTDMRLAFHTESNLVLWNEATALSRQVHSDSTWPQNSRKKCPTRNFAALSLHASARNMDCWSHRMNWGCFWMRKVAKNHPFALSFEGQGQWCCAQTTTLRERGQFQGTTYKLYAVERGTNAKTNP